jgi:hypothetical protein
MTLHELPVQVRLDRQAALGENIAQFVDVLRQLHEQLH